MDFQNLAREVGLIFYDARATVNFFKTIEGRKDVVNLKLAVSQAEVYLRPIQKSLTTDPMNEDEVMEDILETCLKCKRRIPVSQLREPVEDDCISSISDVTEDDLPELGLPESVEKGYESSVSDGEEVDTHAIINSTINYCLDNGVKDPVEILRIFQGKVVSGRQLELHSPEETVDGETNAIHVSRNDIYETGFEEIQNIPSQDLRKTLEVQFYGETAVDLGGPRKEFFRLILQEIHINLFSPCKEWSKDYETAGKLVALSLLQNGPLPRFLSAELVSEVFGEHEPRPFLADFRKGLDALEMYKVGNTLKGFQFLFQPGKPTPLTVRMITNMLKPTFSDEGSNARRMETSVYTKFIKYIREVASARRGEISLCKVMRFITGVEEEPVLGFSIHPSTEFVQSNIQSFLPTANTCINRLYIPRPSLADQLPDEQILFQHYDYAFAKDFYGIM